MNAVVYDTFGAPPEVRDVPAPQPSPGGVVLQVGAAGVCRSDWHGWMGHDPDIRLPHVPGHEFAGVIASVGVGVTRWQVGDRVAVPFVCACGTCLQCAAGNQQVCDAQSQPGFTHWGAFAEYVAVERADVNLVRLPDTLSETTAASLGCRFATAFRAVVDQGRASAGQWVAVHGCGGVGLSAVMIAGALGANVVAIDINPAARELAQALGATVTIDGAGDVVNAVRDLTGGGAHVSLDALGHPTTCFNSVACLRKRGRHVQVGLLLAEQSRPALPMDLVIARELELYGSHGMQAHRYDAMLAMIASGAVDPAKLIGRTIPLADAPAALMAMDRFQTSGVTVITTFR